MKKRIYLILIASLLLLCACQPTPDEPVVLQKDQDLMIQQGSATLAPEAAYTPPEVPERYRFDFQDGALTIHADAEIVVPSEPMPIVNNGDETTMKRTILLTLNAIDGSLIDRELGY